MDTLLDVTQAAERLNSSVRFIRRLIAEDRIAYVKLGRHVRIAAGDLEAFVAAGRVEPGVSREPLRSGANHSQPMQVPATPDRRPAA